MVVMELRHQAWVRVSISLTAALSIFAAVFGVLGAQSARAAQSIPYLINFQGRLTDNNGNILTDGSYNVKFRIWDAATSGTNQWEADRVRGASDHRVTVTNGLFNIQFGDTSQGDPALSPSLFNNASNLYLEVELPTPATATCSTNGCASFTEGAMTPRQPLASSPYAFNSDTLDGLDSTAFAQLSSANTFTAAQLFAPTTASTVALTVKASTAGGSNALEVFDSSGTRQGFFDSSGALNVSQAISAPTTANTINGLVINAGALSAVTGYTQTSGTFSQTFSSGTAASGQTLAFTNSNTVAAGVTMQGINITPSVSAPTSGTNVLNIVNFAAGAALTAAENANGINFASATGYTNFINTPSFKLSSAGAVTGVNGLTVTNTTTTAITANTVTTGNVISATGISTGTALNLASNSFSTGTALSIGGTGLTSGTGVLFNTTSNAQTTAKAISIAGAAAAVTADVSGALINVAPTRTQTAATTRNDSLSFLNLTRSITTNNASAVYNITGALANLQSTCNVTLGTCNDSSNILSLNQQYATASGTVLNVQGAGTGQQANFDASNASANGVAVDVQSSSSSQYVLKLTSGNAATNVLFARADGNVGIGTATPGAKLDVNGTANATSFSVGGTAGSTTTCSGGQVLQNQTVAGGIVTGGGCATVGGGGANTSLNNLTSTAINQSLISAADNTLDLGAAGNVWANVFTGNVDAGTTTTALTIGGTNASAITVGRSGIAVSLPGGLTTSGGTINAGSGTITTSGNISTTGSGTITSAGAISAPTSANTINGLIINGGNLSGIVGYTQTSGTVSQTLSSASAATAHSLSVTNSNAGAGIMVSGFGLTPGNTSASSGTNVVNLMNFAAGAALGSNAQTNGLNFVSATGYTNFINTPTAVLSSAGAWTGLTGVALTSGNITTSGGISTTGSGQVTSAGAFVGPTSSNTINGIVINGGTISTGTWQATAIDATHGGTGQSTYGVGDLLFANSTTSLNRLAAVATGSCLISQGTNTAPVWGSCGAGSANTTLSNLGTTSINASLTPNANNSLDVGSASAIWKDIFTGNIDAGTTTTALTIGTAGTTTAVTIGRSGLQVSVPGGVSSTGTITTSGNISTTGSGTITSAGAISAPTSTNTINGLVVSGGALSSVTGYTQTSGTVSQTLSSAAAATAHSLSVTNSNAGAGVTVAGLGLTPGNTSASSGTNIVNLLNFAAGAALGANAQTNGLSFASAVGYSNFINTPTAVLSSAGAWTGLTGVALSSGTVTTPGGISTTGSGQVTSAGAFVGPTATNTINGIVINGGTISTGNWQGTAVDATHGGTGQNTYAVGDLLFANSTTSLSKLAAVAVGSCLISQGTNTAPIWGPCSAGNANTTLSNLGTTSINADLLPSANNLRSLGSATLAWQNLFAANLDTGTVTTALTIGTANAASIQIGKSGVAVSAPGGVSTSGGTVNAGAGSITTSGALSTTGTGTLTVAGGATSLTGPSAGSSIAVTATSGATSNVGLLVQGVSSQAADLAEVKTQASGGTTVLAINSSGVATFSQVQPASLATNGTNAGTGFTVGGGKGGNTSGAGTTAGNGATIFISAGDGGDAPSGSTTGAGGAVMISGGAVGGGGGTANFFGRGNVVLQSAGGFTGIGTAGPVNTLTIKGLTVADSSAQVAIGTAATTSKGLVVQGVASQAANLIEAQTSAGPSTGIVFSVSPTGVVTGSSFSGSGASLTSLNASNLATGSGAVNLTSTTSALTLTSGSGTIVLGSSTVQRAAAGLTLDVNNGAASTLTVTNSNASFVANLSVEGGVGIGTGQVFSVGATNGSTVAACSASQYLSTQAVTGGLVTGGSCATNDLQTTYGNSTSPATIALTDGKNFVINAADTTTDPSVLVNLQCATCSASGGRFGVQDNGTDVLTVNPTGQIVAAPTAGQNVSVNLAGSSSLAVAATAAPTTDLVSITNLGQPTATAGVNGLNITYVGGAGAIESSGERIDTTPGTTAGSTWNGLRIVSTTNANANVALNGIKIDGPGSGGLGTETGLNITTGWDIGLNIQSGGMQLTAMTDPAAPASGNLRVYAKNVAGRTMLKSLNSTGVDFVYQPSLFQQNVFLANPGSAGSTGNLNAIGAPVTSSGTYTNTLAGTESSGYMANYNTGTTSGTTAGFIQSTSQYYRGSVANGDNGFFVFTRMSFPDTITNYQGATGARFWAGLSSQTAVATMVGSDAPTGDFVGFRTSGSAGDTTFRFLTRNNATTTNTPTGVTMAQSKEYDLYFYVKPFSSSDATQNQTIFWRIDNLTDGTAPVENSVTTTLPTASTAMRYSMAIQNLTGASRNLRFQRAYVETDR